MIYFTGQITAETVLANSDDGGTPTRIGGTLIRYAPGDFPIAKHIHADVLSLRLWTSISEEQVERVITAAAKQPLSERV